MVKKVLLYTRRMKPKYAVAVLALLGLLAGFAAWYSPVPATNPVQEVAAETEMDDMILAGYSDLPAMLSTKDRILYRDIFLAQKKADWKTADLLIARLSDRLLLGHILAERYLHKSYTTPPQKLTQWLEEYSDHPRAFDIYTLALAKSPKLKEGMPFIRKQSTLQGYGDDNGLARNGNDAFSLSWYKAMRAWRSNDKTLAAGIFAGLATKDDVPAWNNAAAAFWAWRSYSAIGEKKEALRYLKIAAAKPRSFYGILARKELKQSLGLDKQPVTLSDSDVLEIIGEPPIRRVIALSESGAVDLAEQELRTLFPQLEKEEQMRLLALAHKLNLASVQIAMAKHLSDKNRSLDFARYPVPHWQPHEGFSVDPALIYALARQESGFHNAAVSPAGALGIMQLMPKTAVLMKKRLKETPSHSLISSAHANEAVLNVTLGQSYVEHLLGNALVENNLLFMLTAYNAGPGRLMEWKKTIDYGNDPLLFLESIPFSETRNYVMQVMTNYWIYSELAGTPSMSLHALLKGQWPSYEPSILPIAANSRTASPAG